MAADLFPVDVDVRDAPLLEALLELLGTLAAARSSMVSGLKTVL